MKNKIKKKKKLQGFLYKSTGVEIEKNVVEDSYIHFQSFFTFDILIPLTLKL